VEDEFLEEDRKYRLMLTVNERTTTDPRDRSAPVRSTMKRTISASLIG
jgi:hypothetical protein